MSLHKGLQRSSFYFQEVKLTRNPLIMKVFDNTKKHITSKQSSSQTTCRYNCYFI